MKTNLNPETDHHASRDAIDAILASEEDLIPSSGFLAAMMERVREEAATPKPIPFPWLRALPGIVLIAAAFGWLGFELVHAVEANPQEFSVMRWHVTVAAATRPDLGPIVWVALALGVAMISWLLSRRIAGGSGLL
ncbi:MAG TPA: hypothetical protein VGG45_05710 [Terracidiphilus sp.]|jgi:hypothetical protein